MSADGSETNSVSLFTSDDVARTVSRLAHQIIERTAADAPGSGPVVLLGIPTRGVTLACTCTNQDGDVVIEGEAGIGKTTLWLSLLRQALGTQTAPPNQVMVGLALFLTLFVMGPTFDKIYTEAYLPLQENRIQMTEAMNRGAAPLKDFMLKQTRQSDLAMFAKISRTPALQGPEDVPLRVLIPAFVTSELKTAFQIGFAIFIPFLIIDMVVASVLMSMGMMMMSPAVISLPFKMMLFVLVDGWQLLLGSLSQSFN